MSSEHVEVLERLRGVLEHGKMGDKCLIAPDLVTAAIASLSAPQPPAEAQPVGGGEVDDGSADASVWTLIALMERVGGERDSGYEGSFITMTLDQVYALEALLTARGHDPGWVDTEPPSAPVGVEWLSELSDDELRIIFYADPKLVTRLKAALTQQPAADHSEQPLDMVKQPAAVGDTRRLEYLIDNELLVHRLSDTGLWMVTTGDLTPAIDGSEYDTWREAIDDALATQPEATR